MNDLQSIKDFFVQHTKFTHADIKLCEFFYDGYTNLSYKIHLSNQDIYQVKITRFKQVTMINESLIFEHYLPESLLYYDDQGNMIKLWTTGENLNFDSEPEARLILLFNEIHKFHTIPAPVKIQTFNYFAYNRELGAYPQDFQHYQTILSKYSHSSLVVSHNDINFKNTIMYKKNHQTKIHFIDFEWTTLNYCWFDYINLFCEEELYDEDYLKQLIPFIPQAKNLHDVYALLFVRWMFTLGWATHEMNHLPNMQAYQERCFKNINWLKTKCVF